MCWRSHAPIAEDAGRVDDPPAVARELGPPRNHLYKWQTELEGQNEAGFPGSGNRPASENELQRPRRKIASLREELDILKKAAPYLARESGWEISSSATMGPSTDW